MWGRGGLSRKKHEGNSPGNEYESQILNGIAFLGEICWGCLGKKYAGRGQKIKKIIFHSAPLRILNGISLSNTDQEPLAIFPTSFTTDPKKAQPSFFE